MSEAITRHYHELYCYALRLSRNRSDAEDLVQETFCKALVAWDPSSPWDNPRAWLYRTMYNTFVSHVRKYSGRFALFDSLEDMDWAKEDDDLADGVLGRELLKEVADFIDALPPKQRRVFLLRHQRGYEFAEIAKEMGVSLQSARSCAHQVHLKLRETFEVPWRCD